jgi:hypothetical protein
LHAHYDEEAPKKKRKPVKNTSIYSLDRHWDIDSIEHTEDLSSRAFPAQTLPEDPSLLFPESEEKWS